MNLTLSVDEEVVERARETARAQGTSLNALIREFLEELAGRRRNEDVTREILTLLREQPGNSGGRRFSRDEIYAERIDRYRGGK